MDISSHLERSEVATAILTIIQHMNDDSNYTKDDAADDLFMFLKKNQYI